MVRTIPQPSDEDKVQMLERLIKALTGAKRLTYADWKFGGKRISLEDVDVHDVKLVSTCGEKEYAGLVLEFNAEPYLEEPIPELLPDDVKIEDLEDCYTARIDADIWFWKDPWTTIEELKEKIQSLSENAIKEDEQ